MVVAGLLHSRAAGHRLGAQVLHHAGLRGEPTTWPRGPRGPGARSRAAAYEAVQLDPGPELSPP